MSEPAGPENRRHKCRRSTGLAWALVVGGLAGVVAGRFQWNSLPVWQALVVAAVGLGLTRGWRWARTVGRAVFAWLAGQTIYWLVADPFEWNVLLLAVVCGWGLVELVRWPLAEPDAGSNGSETLS